LNRRSLNKNSRFLYDRKSTTNAAYSVADYLVSPILMIAVTPFLVSRLGLGQYGIWMLANAVVGTMGVFNMGLGDATIKYVSTYHGKMDEIGVKRVVASTLTIYGLLGGFIAVLAFWAAPLLVGYVFKIEASYQILAVHAIQLAGIGLAVRSIDSVFMSTLRGYERYDLAAKVNMVVKIVTVSCAVCLVAFGYAVVGILVGTIVIAAFGALAQAILCRQLIPGLSFSPTLDRVALREIFGFGLYSWIQGMGGMIFSQADRLLIGAMLGATEVAYYTVCVQLAQQIHSVVAAGFHFLFPLISNKFEHASTRELRQIYAKSLFINVSLAILLAFPLVFFGKQILTLWMGSGFANESYVLLAILSTAFFLLAINVVPHNTLLGLGKVRFVAVSNWLGGVLSFIGVVGFIPLMGINGAAIGRLFYGPAISINYIKVSSSI